MHGVLVDAGPLIYLAKLEALDVFSNSGHTALVTAEVERETARAGLAYDHPDALVIAEALRSGMLVPTDLSERERFVAERLRAEAGGLDAGEAEVLSAAVERRMAVALFERRAVRLARSLGLDTWSPVRLLFAGTRDAGLLRDRIRRFAGMVEMRLDELQHLIELIEARGDDR